MYTVKYDGNIFTRIIFLFQSNLEMKTYKYIIFMQIEIYDITRQSYNP